jgi:O-antigen/teichoic acid export membrane protein
VTVRRAAAWSLASQYATFLIQFAASVIIARFFLPPAEVGLFSIALAAAMVVAVFQDMGITRFVSGQKDMQPEAVGDYAFVAVAIGWAVAAAVALAAPAIARFYGEDRLVELLLLIAASYIIAPFATVPAAMLVRAMDFRALFAVNVGSTAVGYGVALVLAWHGEGAASLAWSVVVIAIVRAIAANVFHPIRPRRPARRAVLAPMLSFSSASFVISVSGAIGQRSQDLIVGRILGLVSTGLFSRASALAGQLSALVSGAISTVFYAAFARKRDAGEPLAAPYLHLIACNTALNWAAMAGLALAAEPLVLLLYGERWAEAAVLLRWMAIGEMLFVAIPLQMDIPILLGRIRTLIWVNLVDTCAAVTILALFATRGVEAAAVGRIAYGVVWWSIYATFQSRLVGFRFADLLAVYARSGLCALAAGAPLLAALAARGWDGSGMGLAELVLLSGAGAGTWLIALRLVRHPAWDEVTMVFAAALATRRPQPAE